MHPYIISASRREDIPAFRSEFLIKGLERGYIDMFNFYSNSSYKIYFDKVKLAVFWSKNPRPLMKYLDELPFKYYFQFTLNDYPEYEHNVPPLDERIQTFIDLSNKIGKKKVIWRYDPLIIDYQISEDDLMNRIKNIGDQLYKYTEKLVFSYVDPYKKLGNEFKEIPDNIKISVANKLIELNKNWGLKLGTCAEKINLEGISHNKCIDPELIMEICGKQRWITDTKDKNQRTECGCSKSTDVGSFKCCKHKCLYCYAQ